MALDDFQMPNFRDEDGSTYVWDPTSSSYVKKPASDNRPDIGHATGGDNDLFDPFQHTEQAGVPELEGYMASSATEDFPYPDNHQVKCPNCQELTSEQICTYCGKDLTPEWNVHGQENEFFGVHPEHNDASEFWSWPQNVPKPDESKHDDSFPSMNLSKTKTANEEWDDMFGDPAEGAGPALRTEVGRWISTLDGQIHVGQGQILHEQIEARDGLTREQEIACGSVYNDGAADTQAVFHPERFNLEETQQQLQQVFGQITLSPPVGQDSSQKGAVFQPFAITQGYWFVSPGRGVISGLAWVKERSNGVAYQPNMVLFAEHLRPEDDPLYENGAAAIVTATGGTGSHATIVAGQRNIPVVVSIGEVYNKVETGNHVKIDPARETIEVMPGDVPREQNQDAWNTILNYQQQREQEDPSLIPQRPMAFSHIIEEEAWKLANTPNLDSCPECSAPMMNQDSEAVCHDCGHKQPVIQATAGAAVLAIPELLGAGEAAAGAAGGAGGISGIGGMMNKAMQGAGWQTGKNMIGGDGAPGGLSLAPPQMSEPDPSIGTVSRQNQKFAAWDQRHAGILSGIVEALLNAAKGSTSWQNWANAFTHPASPLSYVDDALMGGVGQAQQQLQQVNQQGQQMTGATTFGEEEVGAATKNDGTNSTDEASDSGTEGKKEQGDGPEQLKDVDGGHDSQGSGPFGEDPIDPKMQDKALKAFHMNLPLVIEFAESDEPGADNPILMALDQLLEEAFPGYKDGHDQEGGATDEHPLDSPESEPKSDMGEPDAKSEGADKKEAAMLASVWHFADTEMDPGYAQSYEPGGYNNPGYGAETSMGQYVCPNCEMSDDDYGQGTGLCRHCGEKLVDVDGDIYPPEDDQAVGDYEMYGPDQPSMGDYVSQTKTAILDPNQMVGVPPGMPAGAGGPALEMCPRCGQAHPPGTPCPVADITAPITTGDGMGQMSPTHVITKWHLAMPSNMPVQAPQMAAGAPAAPATCPICHQNHLPGTPCPTPDVMQQPAATGMQWMAPAAMMSPGVSYSSIDDHFALFDDADDSGDGEDDKDYSPQPGKTRGDGVGGAKEDDYHSDDDWTDDSGQPLQEGAEYEMKTAASPIPDRVTIERILPEKLTYILHSGDVDFRDTITRDQLDLDGAVFSAVDYDDTGEDSMDRFPGEGMPTGPRPGDDALPQQDDLSTPMTAVSSIEDFEPVTLDNYTGSFQGDKVDDRSWLKEESSEVEVDPGLMAKFAGKAYNPREQREFIEEKGEARNLDRLDLAGTHYLDSDDLDSAFNW